MSTFSIQINAQSESAPGGELLDAAGAASIRIFQNDPASNGVDSVRLTPFSVSSPTGEFSMAEQIDFGNLRCVAQSCISDVSLLGNIEPSECSTAQALVQTSYFGDLATMSDSSDFTRIHADLISVLPKVDLALAGNLNQSELAQLIADIQSQVLELNSLGSDVFGDLSAETAVVVTELENEGASDLMTSLLADASFFSQSVQVPDAHSLAMETTLDGLFTAPEAFPLTMDFSSPNAVLEASELFASAGSSSISSSADNNDTNVTDSSGADFT